MKKIIKLIVEEKNLVKRLDNFINLQITDISRTRIKNLILDGFVKINNTENSYFKNIKKETLELHIAHNEGNYFCSNNQMKEIEDNNQIALFYCNKNGEVSEKFNPNGTSKSIAGIFNKEKNILGIIVAFIGLFILLGAPNLEGRLIGVLLLLFGAFTWSLGMIMARPLSKKIGGFAVTAWICLFAGPLLLLGSFIFDGNTINYFLSADLKGWSIVAFLGLIMQPIAYGTWYHVMGRNPVHKVMPVMLLLPLTGLSTAIFLLGEEPTKQVFIGGVIILAGIGMILFSKSKTK